MKPHLPSQFARICYVVKKEILQVLEPANFLLGADSDLNDLVSHLSDTHCISRKDAMRLSSASVAELLEHDIRSPHDYSSKLDAIRPFWDADQGLLTYGRMTCKWFRSQPARNQRLLLSAFQEDGWPATIDDPLSGHNDAAERLKNAVGALNRTCRVIRFSIRGTRIHWKLTPSSPLDSGEPMV